MQFVVVACLAIAAFGIGAIDGGFFDHIVHPRSPLSLDLEDEGLSNKVVGGYRAAKYQFPFVAYVRLDGEIMCTGSLVHARWVLTVECDVPIVGTDVVLGQFDRKEENDYTQIITIIQKVKFNDTAGDTYLLKLSKRAQTRGVAVSVIDLVSSKRVMNRALKNRMECVQVGWGYQRRDKKFVAARFLRATGVNFVDDSEVTRRGYGSFLRSGHIGTEAEYTNKCDFDGMCYGDNGGPVVCSKGKNFILTAMFAYFSSWDGCMTGVKASKNVFELYDWVQSTIA